MSDSKRLDVFALVIAGLSFLLSGASLWYSRAQVGLTTGQVKAFVQIADAKLVEPIGDASFIKVQLKLKNFGQTAAVNVHADMDYQDDSPDHTGEPNRGSMLQFGSMGPSFERTVTLTSNRRSRGEWPTPSMRGDRAVYFFGTVWYTDDTTNQDRKEDWCYKLTLKTQDDLKSTALEPCVILTYQSKGDPLKESN